MAADFKDLLKINLDDVEKPKPVPAGTYTGRIAKYEFNESSNKKTPFVRYYVQLTGAEADVDSDALEGINLAEKQLRKDYYITKDALYRLKDFLGSCGIEVQGRALGETIPESLNASVILDVKQRNSEDGKDIFNDVGDMRGAG